ncbi:LEA type 2 family protein [Hymenobacter sp. BT559]|uniref:NDR1/HIN1-like protein n=1 Tax=Hymenobacter sp. BT559 TaxID=2795729 RepID=UPI001A354473|nr:LEA type 2 family protein [Hymenobacter sp. BT559]MBJ6146225.1 LEA type 2 family protein [Hymenobacter sp. BT559]
MPRVIQLSIRFASSLLLGGGLLPMASCALHEAAPGALAQREPELRVRAIEAASLNGLDVLPLRVPADLDLPRRNQVIAGYVNKQLPLRMRMQLSAYNPNAVPATIAGVAYTVLVDGKALGTGRQAAAVSVPAGDSVRVPLTFEFNTYKFLGDDAMPALRNFALGFGDLRRQRVTLQVRPLGRTPKGHLSAPIARPALAYDEAATVKTAKNN